MKIERVRLFVMMGIVLSFTLPGKMVLSAATPACPAISANNISQLVPIQRIPGQEWVKAIQFSPDGKLLTLVQLERFKEAAQQWDLASGMKRSQVKLFTSDAPAY